MTGVHMTCRKSEVENKAETIRIVTTLRENNERHGDVMIFDENAKQRTTHRF